MNYFKVVITLICTMQIIAFPVTASEPIEFNFCYENRELLPHFTGNTTQVPTQKPGALIEILHQLDKKLAQIKIKYQRAPWQRCLSELKSGKVDALIGSYAKQREAFAIYPKIDGNIDPQRAINANTMCLLHKKSANIRWDGTNFTTDKSFIVSITRGYQMGEVLKTFGFKIYETDSEVKAHELLLKNRVEASVGSCDMTNIPKSIVLNPIPLSTHYGYLFVSKKFYYSHRLLVKSLWRKLIDIDRQHYYHRYPPQF